MKKLVAELGSIGAVAKALSISRGTVYRLLRGAPVQRGTMAMVAEYLRVKPGAKT